MSYGVNAGHELVTSWHAKNVNAMKELNDLTTYQVTFDVADAVLRGVDCTAEGRLFGKHFLFEDHPMLCGLYGQA